MKRNNKLVVGIDFIDVDGERVRNVTLTNEDGVGIAIADFRGDKLERCLVDSSCSVSQDEFIRRCVSLLQG